MLYVTPVGEGGGGCRGGGDAQDIKNINGSVGKLVKASLLASAEKKFFFESGDGAPR